MKITINGSSVTWCVLCPIKVDIWYTLNLLYSLITVLSAKSLKNISSYLTIKRSHKTSNACFFLSIDFIVSENFLLQRQRVFFNNAGRRIILMICFRGIYKKKLWISELSGRYFYLPFGRNKCKIFRMKFIKVEVC